MRTLYFLLAVLFVRSLSIDPAYAQETDLEIGTRIPVTSTVLNETRDIMVYLPDSYEERPEKEYPVLYLLNGNSWFLHGVTLEQTFTELNLTPEFIVVGIDTDVEGPNARYAFFTEGASLLLDFIENEVVDYIDKTYRTSTERMLFGWEYAGAFALESVLKKPTVFSAGFITSPWPLIDDARIERINDLLPSLSDYESFMYIATASNEGVVAEEANELIQLLDEKAPESLRWVHESLDYEASIFSHRTTPLGGLYHALRAYYHDYARLEFTSIEQYVDSGGLENVLDFYTKRARRYDLESGIPEEGMFRLARLGFDNNNYAVFDELMSHFIDIGFIENLNPNWSIRFAEYYVQNQNPNKARDIYIIMTNRFPNEPTPFNRLGRVYQVLGDKAKAIQQHKKAVELAKSRGHRNLSQFEKDLANAKKADN